MSESNRRTGVHPGNFDGLQKTLDSPNGPFNPLIRAYMAKHGMRRIEEFAAKSGIGESTLYNMVLGKKTATGKTQKVAVDTLKKLAATLSVPMHELLYTLEPGGYGRDQLNSIPAAVQIPVKIAGMVGAGKTQLAATEREVFVEADFARSRDLIAFVVYGNSMEGGKRPIHDGDIVIVDRNSTNLDGSPVVARIADDGYVCKKPLLSSTGALDQLISTNLDYADPEFRIIDRERVAEIVGRVVRVIQDVA